MNPADLALATDVISLIAQAASALFSLRNSAAQAQDSTMQTNLSASESNLQTAVAHAKAYMAAHASLVEVPTPATP